MGISFAFVKPDGTNEDLSVIDKQIAEFYGEEPNKDQLVFMDNVSDIGCNVLERTSDSNVTPQSLGAYFTHLFKNNIEMYNKICLHHNGKFAACLPKFLYKDYTFKAWR